MLYRIFSLLYVCAAIALAQCPVGSVPNRYSRDLADRTHVIECIRRSDGALVLPNLPFHSMLPSNYNFTPIDGSIPIKGGAVFTLNVSPCPDGVNGTDTDHRLYLTGLPGAPETVLITGGTCTSGRPVGTIVFTPANNHLGQWRLSSATQGIQEMICAFPAGGGEALITSNTTLLANVSLCGKTSVRLRKTFGVTLTSGAFTILGSLRDLGSAVNTGEELFGTPFYSDDVGVTSLGQGAWTDFLLRSAKDNAARSHYQFMSILYAPDAGGAVGNQVAGYMAIASGAAGRSLWGLNVVSSRLPGHAKVHQQSIEVDFNNHGGTDYALHDALAGNGITIVACCTGWNKGSAALAITDDAATHLWREGIHIVPESVTDIGIDIDGAGGVMVGTIAARQLANAGETIILRRATDVAPTGNFLRVIGNAGAPLFRLDIQGNGIFYATNIQTTNTQVNLANGANNNVAIVNYGAIYILGPVAGFSVTGFDGGVDGRQLKVVNVTGQQMTIANLNAGSIAANRILTLTGADVVLRAGNSFATFIYNSAATNWILESVN